VIDRVLPVHHFAIIDENYLDCVLCENDRNLHDSEKTRYTDLDTQGS
jgi:hypothetical protein